MASPIGFGIVGCGLVSEFHGRALADIPGARLVAACDADAGRLNAFIKHFGGEGYSDFRKMIERPDIHVINVCTPNHLHEEFVVQAAAHGKHVMVEKPPEMTLEKADRLIDACTKAGVKLSTVLQVRFRPAVVALKKAIDEGRFGRLLFMDTDMKWFRERSYYDRDSWRGARSKEGGGVVMQHAFHYIDILNWLSGGIVAVRAQTLNLLHRDIRVEDSALAFFHYTGGAVGTMTASTALYPGTEVRIGVYGENGTVMIEGTKIREWRFREEQSGDRERISTERSDLSAGTGASDFGYLEHRAQIIDMIDAIRNNREPAITGRSGRATLAAVLAIYRSAESGKEISIKEETR